MKKFFNQRTSIVLSNGDSMRFDSKGESERYQFLRDLWASNEIQNLNTQKRFLLRSPCNDEVIGVYVADFVYEVDGRTIVEDYKAHNTITPMFKLKKALFEDNYKMTLHIIYTPRTPIPNE